MAEERKFDVCVADTLAHVAAEICDHYCKYPEQYGDNEEKMYQEHCENCILWLIS